MYEEVYCLKEKTTTELAKIYDTVEVTKRKIRYCRLLDLKGRVYFASRGKIAFFLCLG